MNSHAAARSLHPRSRLPVFHLDELNLKREGRILGDHARHTCTDRDGAKGTQQLIAQALMLHSISRPMGHVALQRTARHLMLCAPRLLVLQHQKLLQTRRQRMGLWPWFCLIVSVCRNIQQSDTDCEAHERLEPSCPTHAGMGAAPVFPYAMAGGTTNLRLSPTRMPTTPLSQPFMTSPTPSLNAKRLFPFVSSNT